MRPALLLPFAIVLAACAGNPATPGPAPARLGLRGADCLDPAFARDWQELDRNHVLVDAGRRKYRITVSGACLFGAGVTLYFEGDPVSGRVCGHPGDRIVTRDGACWIDGMELVDPAAWDALRNAPRGSVDAQVPVR